MPSDRAQTLIGLVQRNGWMVGVEVGVWEGETMFALLDACPNLRMIGVDHWTAQPFAEKNKDTGDAPYCDQSALDRAREWVEMAAASKLYGTKLYGSRVTILNWPSLDAAKIVQSGTVDFVFLDADHRTQAVVDDFNAWRHALRPGGAILGHDANWPSVQRALVILGWPYMVLPGNVWVVQK